MYNGKDVKVILSPEANEVYEELNGLVSEEIKKGIKSSFHQSLLRNINRLKDLLKINPFAGDQIPKRLISEKYKQIYDADNIWRLELPERWRLIYTITGDKLEIITFVLDIFNHKDYDKIFGYNH